MKTQTRTKTCLVLLLCVLTAFCLHHYPNSSSIEASEAVSFFEIPNQRYVDSQAGFGKTLLFLLMLLLYYHVATKVKQWRNMLKIAGDFGRLYVPQRFPAKSPRYELVQRSIFLVCMLFACLISTSQAYYCVIVVWVLAAFSARRRAVRHYKKEIAEMVQEGEEEHDTERLNYLKFELTLSSKALFGFDINSRRMMYENFKNQFALRSDRVLNPQ